MLTDLKPSVRRVALSTVAAIQVGYQARAGIKEGSQGTHRLIQSKDFDSFHRLQPENLTHFSPDRNPEIYSVHRGDVLFQARGMTHFACLIEDDLENTLAAGSFYILRIRDKRLLPAYLDWWLNQPRAQAYFSAQAVGSGISFVSKKTLGGLEVEVPPLDIQEKITRINALLRNERILAERLSLLRSQLANAVCMKAVMDGNNKSDIRGI